MYMFLINGNVSESSGRFLFSLVGVILLKCIKIFWFFVDYFFGVFGLKIVFGV